MKSALALALASLSLLSGCKSDEPVSGRVEDQVEVTAKVTAVDVPHRTLTLASERGYEVLVGVAPEVENLAQVRAGDSVAVTYTAAISWKVRAADQPAPVVAAQASVDKAKPGEKPAVKLGDSVTVTTTIAAIDEAQGTVSLTGPRGNTIVLTPRDRENLGKVAVGQHVDVTYSEAVAVGVRPAPAPAKK